MLKSIKAIFIGLVILMGTIVVGGIVLMYTVFFPFAPKMPENLLVLIPSIAAGLLSGHYVALIAGRKEILHALIVVLLYIGWNVPALMRTLASNVDELIFNSIVNLFLVAISALIMAFRIYKKRAQQRRPEDADTVGSGH